MLPTTEATEANRTYGDGLSIAFELVITPAIFGLIGFGLDRWLELTPFLTVSLTVVALGTVVGLTIWRYGLDMERTDAERREALATKSRPPARWERAEARLAAEAEAAAPTETPPDPITASERLREAQRR